MCIRDSIPLEYLYRGSGGRTLGSVPDGGSTSPAWAVEEGAGTWLCKASAGALGAVDGGRADVRQSRPRKASSLPGSDGRADWDVLIAGHLSLIHISEPT